MGAWFPPRHVDGDSFVPKLNAQTTSELPPTPLAECVTKLAHRSRTAEAMHERLEREDKIRSFFLMAAVCPDTKALGKALEARDEHGVAQLMQERVLCAIKMHSNGTLEAKPGFSEEEPEREDQGPFATAQDMQVIADRGHRLTTFSLRCLNPQDGSLESVFQYAIENLHGQGSIGALERMVAEAQARDAKAVATRREVIPLGFQSMDMPHGVECVLRMRVELVSALRFDADWLCCEYQVLLPDGWLPGGDSVKRWERNEQNQWVMKGTTQVGCVKELHRRSWANAAVHAGRTKARVGVAAAFAVALLGCVLGIVFGADVALWLVSGLVVSVGAYGITPGVAGTEDEVLATVHWNHPVSFSFYTSLTDPAAAMALSPPQILLQVSTERSFERRSVVGYGYFTLPPAAGNGDTEVQTWRPVGGFRSQLDDFFVGGANRLSDMRFAALPPTANDHVQRFVSKFGFVTAGSGSVRVRTTCIEQHAQGTNLTSALSQRGLSQRKPLVDQLMRMYLQPEELTSDEKLDKAGIDRLNRGGSKASHYATLLKQMEDDRATQIHAGSGSLRFSES